MAKFLSNIDLGYNELQNAKIQVLAAAPESPKEGQIYYDSVSHTLRYYSGSKWIDANNDTVKMTGDDIAEAINASNVAISKDKIDGLTELVSGAVPAGGDLIDSINKESAKKISDSRLDLSNFSVEVSSKVNQGAQNATTSANDYTDQAIAKLVGTAPENLDTFQEIAQAIQDNEATLKAIQDTTHKYVKTIGDGVATEFTITHSLNDQNIIVQLHTTKAPYSQVIADIELTDKNTVTVRTAEPLATDELTVVIIG